TDVCSYDLAGCRIYRLEQPDDDAANAASAFADPDLGIAGLRQPDTRRVAGRLGICGRRDQLSGEKRHPKQDQKSESACHEVPKQQASIPATRICGMAVKLAVCQTVGAHTRV